MKQIITCEYIKEYLSAHDYTCELVSTEYVNCASKLAFRCECGNIFYASWSNIKKMYGLCKECTNLRRRQPLQAYQARADEFYGNGLYVITGAKDSRLDVVHTECGNAFTVRRDHFFEGQGCKFCNLKYSESPCALSQDEFMSRVSKYDADYEFLSAYKNNHTPIAVRCKKCGEIFSRIPSHLFDRGVGCPQCSRSNGEYIIGTYLKDRRIDYIPQHRFEDCKNDKHLSFDFYIPSLNVCIEYQGQQHYAPVPIFGGELAFERQQKCDHIKRTYCEQNGIKLIEIPFGDFKNIGNILDGLLSNCNPVCMKEVV